MKFAPNKFYNNNSFANWNLDSIFLHIFYMIFTKLRILKLLSKAAKFITSRIEREKSFITEFQSQFPFR